MVSNQKKLTSFFIYEFWGKHRASLFFPLRTYFSRTFIPNVVRPVLTGENNIF
ncbi:hypothetical protein KP13_04126 (plasmid) [Klebsiella pneumoniae subsp. pneumoniae Kp13]|nr:hypothetical protein KP13_04126 [Klebsiella pneumoniae subsp. pneumoniae Kp13]